jgi:hypothetical protein
LATDEPLLDAIMSAGDISLTQALVTIPSISRRARMYSHHGSAPHGENRMRGFSFAEEAFAHFRAKSRWTRAPP